jgi:hypothetical protein
MTHGACPPCQLVLGAIAVGASSFLTAITDAGALDAYQNAIRGADAWLVQGNCVQSVAPCPTSNQANVADLVRGLAVRPGRG